MHGVNIYIIINDFMLPAFVLLKYKGYISMVKHSSVRWNPVNPDYLSITGFAFQTEINYVMLISLLLINDLSDMFVTFFKHLVMIWLRKMALQHKTDTLNMCAWETWNFYVHSIDNYLLLWLLRVCPILYSDKQYKINDTKLTWCTWNNG